MLACTEASTSSVDEQQSVECRSCAARAGVLLLDLGPQPDPDMLLDPEARRQAPTAPVRAWICASCDLVQLVGPKPAGPPNIHGHAAGPSEGRRDPWWAAFDGRVPPGDRLIVDIDVADPGIGDGFIAAGFPVIGYAATTAGFMGSRDWIHEQRFDRSAAASIVDSGLQAGLVIASHALPHVDDLNDLIASIEVVLAPGGLIAVEFHHALELARGQFDVLSHAHRSYFSLQSLGRLLERHGLTVEDAASSPQYGGTVRAIARRASSATPVGASESAAAIGRAERAALIHQAAGFADLPGHVDRVSNALLDFLDSARRDGLRVAGYGAASRGTNLLNIAGVNREQLPFVVDRSQAKQGRLLPGAMIPVLPTDEIDRTKPDRILILPWPLAAEIMAQLSGARAWGARFARAMPRLEILP
jgi:hypothetical protein